MQQKVALQFAGRHGHVFSMQPKTEEFLNLLLWSADMLARPTFRNLTDSYESWAYRNGLMRQVATLQEQRHILGGGKINVESLLLLEARPCAGESDADIVAGAWDFERINRRYERHLKVLEERPRGVPRNDATAKALLRWATTEREGWL